MNDEMKATRKNNTWELVHLTKDKQPIDIKWIYKVKQHANGFVDQHKARLVAKGFSQKSSVDYSKTFAPTARFDTIKTIN